MTASFSLGSLGGDEENGVHNEGTKLTEVNEGELVFEASKISRFREDRSFRYAASAQELQDLRTFPKKHPKFAGIQVAAHLHLAQHAHRSIPHESPYQYHHRRGD